MEDDIATRFTAQFYSGLFSGRSVKVAFDLAQAGVASSSLKRATDVSRFCLLPADCDHDVSAVNSPLSLRLL